MKSNNHSPSPPPDSQGRSIGISMTLIAWAILFILLFFYFTQEEQQRFNPNQRPETGRLDGRNTLVLNANRQNHFVMTGRVNGSKTTLLLDTGATRVSVPEDMADRLGLQKGSAGYAITANGRVRTYSTVIDTLQLGNIMLYGVAADINPGMNGLNEILLGMSALSQIEFTQRDGQLLLIQ